MDEGDTEDTSVVSRVEDVRAQGKDGDILVENRNVLREPDLPRSSVQQFVDLLDGKDPDMSVNIEGMSQDPNTSFRESGKGRVHELKLGHSSSGFVMMNEGETMEEMLNEWQHGHRPGSRVEAETSLLKESPTTSRLLEERLEKCLPGQAGGNNADINPGQPTFSGSDEVVWDAFSSGGVRMKVINKSSEYPEYIVKNTLRGKGVLCRGPNFTGTEARGRNSVEAASSPLQTPNPVDTRVKSVAPSCQGVFEFGASRDSLDDGVNLREWMKSGHSRLHKVDRLCVFKEILDLVHSYHSGGKVLVDLRPACFRLMSSKKIKYCGRLSGLEEMRGTGSVAHKDVVKAPALKRPLEQGMSPFFQLGAKHQKSTDNVNFYGKKPQFQLGYGLTPIANKIDVNVAGPGDIKLRGNSSRLHMPPPAQQHAVSVIDQLEEKWYKSPEELLGRGCTSSSNIYCLGVFLFELLSSFNSGKTHAAAMSDLRHRILPPNFLSENPKEAGFCLWLLHPEPSLRPVASDILQSKVVRGFEALRGDENPLCIEQDEGESELLLHFLCSMKEQKQKHASKLVDDLGCIEADIRELEKRHLFENPTSLISSKEGFLYVKESGVCEIEGDSRFLKNVAQLESAYFSAKPQIQDSLINSVVREDRDILINRENWSANRREEDNYAPLDDRGDFFDGLCKYARYSKLEVCGTLRNREITNSTNVICSLSFDRDEEYFAAAGVSKKIKIFELQALCDDSVDIHYPAIEMSNKSKLSCVCWNSYIRNYLASTDYDGIVKLWDASTGQGFSQHAEHEKRAWSVDFSQLDPTKFASGSDDCSVKLWSINERNSLHTIRNIANVCCVQFSTHSTHLLAFGSADYKIYCYDLRNANVPWCILGGHEKAVSYVKFVDSGTLVSASTDNTLKLWDLNKSSPVGLSNNACRLTLSGHTNEKNFVGLSAADGYIACGSETNEVYTYHKSLSMPITSHKFGSIDPISGKETDDDNGQFVSSVCWKGKSNMIVAANSSGCIKVLQMV